MNGKTVLIVEDEPAIRDMVGFALTRAGFHVDEAVDGPRPRSASPSGCPT
jgi:two-component system, OmpR family, phosphate regulon response regulator PhoB